MSACPFHVLFKTSSDASHRPLPDSREGSAPRVVPPTRPLNLSEMVRLGLRNPIETWPQAVYEEFVHHVRGPGGGLLFVSDPEMIHEIMVASVGSFGRAKEFLAVVEPLAGDAIIAADGERWRIQRKIAAPLFTHQKEYAFVPNMRRIGEQSIASWTESGVPRRIEVLEEMMHISLALIAQSMLSDYSGINSRQMIDGLTTYLSGAPIQSLYAALNLPSWVPMPGRSKRLAARDRLHENLRTLIATRTATGSSKNPEASKDLLDHLLGTVDQDSGKGLSEQDVVTNLLTFMAGGYETTAIALGWTFYLISQHPEVEARALEEIEQVTQGQPVNVEHLKRLSYISQVIQEAMRLYPPLAAIPRRALASIKVGPLSLKAGDSVMISPYVVHRHKKLWERPDEFRPENFSPENVRARHRQCYLPFGAGPRICIGMSFAFTEMLVLVSTLLRAVKFTPIPTERPALKLRLTLRPSNGLPMMVQARE